MPELSDHELLTEFAHRGTEAAFAALVSRHVGLVYSAALRFTNNPHQAEEITQAVFILLARKAAGLSARVVISGWLYQTARLTAANFVKGEVRRHRREQETYLQTTLNDADPAVWNRIAPWLDEAMGTLGETDRNAVVLRYFENRSAAEIGIALRMNEETARKRVNRALEKLRRFFAQRGVALSGVALIGAISANSVHAAPAVLAQAVTTLAVAQGVTAGGSTLPFIKGALKIMAWTKAKTAVIVGLGVLLAGGAYFVAANTIWAEKNNFEAEGYIYYGTSGQTRPFQAYVNGNKWLIRTPFNTNGIVYSEESFDGTYLYQYTQLASAGNSQNSSIGYIERDDIPAFNSRVLPIWLAYGASRYFDKVTGTVVRPFLVASGLRRDRDHLLEVEWQRSPEAPFAPSYLYCQEKNYRYRVLEFTNFAGLHIPSKFVFETFRRGASLTNAPQYLVNGFLTKITKPATRQNFKPVMDGHTVVEDWRFPSAQPEKTQPALYMNTAKDWFSPNSPQWQTLLKMWSPQAGGLVWPQVDAKISGVERP
jgi:RNA polymerase sigma factor (sigma-70 family)